MKRRRRRVITLPANRRPNRGLDECPYCGYSAERGQGRIVDVFSKRAVCVRCGSEIRMPR